MEEKNIEQTTNENLNTEFVEETLKNNELEFEYNGTKYRIVRPNFAKKQEAYREKIRKYTELLKDKNNLLEKDLIALYKERNIDIEELQKQVTNLQNKKNNFQLQLGELLAKKAPESDYKIIADEIKLIEEEQVGITIIKNNLLEASIENQLYLYIYSYLIYLVTEKLAENTWIPAWKNYDEFQKSDELLINKLVLLATFLLKDELKT